MITVPIPSPNAMKPKKLSVRLAVAAIAVTERKTGNVHDRDATP